MDIAGTLLKTILINPAESLESWSKLKLCYFSKSYVGIYTNIVKFYLEFSKLPTLKELEVITREPSNRASLIAINSIELDDDISIEILVSALIDEYTQNEALTKLDKFLDNITLLSTDEIKEKLSDIVLYLDEKTHSNESVFLMSDFNLFSNDELTERIPLGINANLDYKSGGFQTTDLIMIGGKRGSGKSIVACNIACNQYEIGNVGLFFSIEQPGHEIFERMLSILSGVPHENIRNRKLSESDLLTLAKTRAKFFSEYESILSDFSSHKDFNKFEKELTTTKKLKENSQIIIVDNHRLTISDIDLHLHKTKAKFGERLKVAVVDYVNQIVLPEVVEAESQYNWMGQVELSKKLKDLARKHNVCIVTPYQIDKTGEARFSKGLLDAADASFILEPIENGITFKTTKSRSFAAIDFSSKMDWNTLRIFPDELDTGTEYKPDLEF
jgi:RecA/RadA recombinase